jgi:hypothetical protein
MDGSIIGFNDRDSLADRWISPTRHQFVAQNYKDLPYFGARVERQTMIYGGGKLGFADLASAASTILYSNIIPLLSGFEMR